MSSSLIPFTEQTNQTMMKDEYNQNQQQPQSELKQYYYQKASYDSLLSSITNGMETTSSSKPFESTTSSTTTGSFTKVATLSLNNDDIDHTNTMYCSTNLNPSDIINDATQKVVIPPTGQLWDQTLASLHMESSSNLYSTNGTAVTRQNVWGQYYYYDDDLLSEPPEESFFGTCNYNSGLSHPTLFSTEYCNNTNNDPSTSDASGTNNNNKMMVTPLKSDDYKNNGDKEQEVIVCAYDEQLNWKRKDRQPNLDTPVNTNIKNVPPTHTYNDVETTTTGSRFWNIDYDTRMEYRGIDTSMSNVMYNDNSSTFSHYNNGTTVVDLTIDDELTTNMNPLVLPLVATPTSANTSPTAKSTYIASSNSVTSSFISDVNLENNRNTNPRTNTDITQTSKMNITKLQHQLNLSETEATTARTSCEAKFNNNQNKGQRIKSNYIKDKTKGYKGIRKNNNISKRSLSDTNMAMNMLSKETAGSNHNITKTKHMDFGSIESNTNTNTVTRSLFPLSTDDNEAATNATSKILEKRGYIKSLCLNNPNNNNSSSYATGNSAIIPYLSAMQQQQQVYPNWSSTTTNMIFSSTMSVSNKTQQIPCDTESYRSSNLSNYSNDIGNIRESNRKNDPPQTLWYWEEDSENIKCYKTNSILTGTNFVAYSSEASLQIEKAYQEYKQNGPDKLSIVLYDNTTVTISFVVMVQTDTRTYTTRRIRRNTEQHIIEEGSAEYTEIESFFCRSLHLKKSIIKIERIENPTLLEPYLVKLRTMKQRDIDNPNSRINNTKEKNDMYQEKSSTDSDLERRWLFHGTKIDVVQQIIKQGFNRSYAKYGCAFGKGVYFAKDASYSCSEMYAQKDKDGAQYIFLCRVAVGDWCKGTHKQIAPPNKPYGEYNAFDSTVDNVHYPTIFVIYHDCQAYPEYLISCRDN